MTLISNKRIQLRKAIMDRGFSLNEATAMVAENSDLKILYWLWQHRQEILAVALLIIQLFGEKHEEM